MGARGIIDLTPVTRKAARKRRKVFSCKSCKSCHPVKNLTSATHTQMIKKLSFIALLLLITLQSASAVRQTKPTLVLTDCPIQGYPGKAKCGTYEVYENRATKKGRKIPLKIVLLPATSEKREADPFVYFAGGPGSAASDDAAGLAQAFPQILTHRDMLFVDQRGTGGSHPLDCKLYDPADLQTYLGYFFPLDDVRKCRAELEANSDLKLYVTTIAADDMDDVRAALGYERLNLFGGSYGTRAALTYLKRHPQHVRAALLQGISPADQLMPRDFPQQTERALQGVLKNSLHIVVPHGAHGLGG